MYDRFHIEKGVFIVKDRDYDDFFIRDKMCVNNRIIKELVDEVNNEDEEIDFKSEYKTNLGLDDIDDDSEVYSYEAPDR